MNIERATEPEKEPDAAESKTTGSTTTALQILDDLSDFDPYFNRPVSAQYRFRGKEHVAGGVAGETAGLEGVPLQDDGTPLKQYVRGDYHAYSSDEDESTGLLATKYGQQEEINQIYEQLGVGPGGKASAVKLINVAGDGHGAMNGSTEVWTEDIDADTDSASAQARQIARNILTPQQRFAYLGLVRVAAEEMFQEIILPRSADRSRKGNTGDIPKLNATLGHGKQQKLQRFLGFGNKVMSPAANSFDNWLQKGLLRNLYQHISVDGRGA